MRILLPIDKNEARATAAAAAITGLPNASETVKVTILNVSPEVDVRDDAIINSEEWYDETDYPDSVTAAETMLQDAGIPVQKRRRHADPATAILEEVDEIDADWIIMSGRKQSPVGKVLFGSVTQSVLLDSDIPVTFVPSGE
jgi:nucleotide-binding universal stress UspA family protein